MRCLGFALLCGFAAAGCAALVVGAGAGAGAYTYVQGEVKRSYAAEYADTVAACTGIFQDLEMTVTGRESDGAQTTFTAERRDGTPVTVKIGIRGLELTEVSVRTGRVGYWSHDLSRKFHEFIERRLKTKTQAGAAAGSG